MLKNAILDRSKRYRYLLERYWGQNQKNIVNFVLLNPSIGDAIYDDPTIKACVRLAQYWKFDGLIITNLFSFRATNPSEMRLDKNPQGPQNDRYIKLGVKKSRMVVVAWGNHGTYCGRDKEVLKILVRVKKPFCLGVTKIGNPKHPLYVRKNTEPKLYKMSQ